MIANTYPVNLHKATPPGFKGNLRVLNRLTDLFIVPEHRRGELSITSVGIYRRIVTKLQDEGRATPEDFAKELWKDTSGLKKADMLEVENLMNRYIREMKICDRQFERLLPNWMPRRYYRGIIDNEGTEIINGAKPGDTIMPDYGYAYATTSKEVAKGFATGHSYDGQDPARHVLMEIKTPIGTRISKNPFHLREVVFPRKARYQLIEKSANDGVTNAILKYIL